MDTWAKELPGKPGVVVCALVARPIRKASLKQIGRFDGQVAGRAIGELRTHPCSDLLTTRPGSFAQRFRPLLLKSEVVMKGELSTWIEQAAGLESSGAAARSTGNERAADAHFRGAF